MIYGHLSNAVSQKYLVQLLSHEPTKYKHLGISKISRNGLSYALMNRNSNLFKDFFFELLGKTELHKGSFGRKAKKYISMLDATHMPFKGKGSEWAQAGENRREAKAHVLMSHDGKPLNMVVTSASICDIRGARMINLGKTEVLVMDRGYSSYSFWKELDNKGITFVTRAKKNMRYRVISKRRGRKPEGILADERIIFENPNNRKKTMELRRIVVKVKKENIVVLTNDLNTSAKVIADLYKSRWQIELFFKWIKQNLKIKRFFGRKRNSVETQLWVAMIVYLLIWMIKKQFKYKGSKTELIRLISMKLTVNINMANMLSPPNNNTCKESERFIMLNFSGQ